MKYDFFEYFSPNAKKNQLEGILSDYYSFKIHPESFHLHFSKSQSIRADEPPVKTKSGVYVKIASSDPDLPGWSVVYLNGSGVFSIGVIQLEEFPKGVRIRFVITYKKTRSILENIAEEILSRWKSFGFTISQFDLEYFMTEGDRSKLTGMSDWRKRRASLFKQIKVRNPEYSKSDVATYSKDRAFEEIRKNLIAEYPYSDEKQIDDEVLRIFKKDYSHGKDEFSESDVKNDYKAMGWKWIDSRSI